MEPHGQKTSELFSGVKAENSRGIFASDGPLYKGAIFGRDSLEVGEDLVDIDSEIPGEILLTLASFQGLKFDKVSEEEPGKIHHEHRSLADIKNDSSRKIYQRLYKMWGGKDDYFTYYGSVDATPLFLRLALRYIEIYGPSILHQIVSGSDGKTRTFSKHVELARDWIISRIRKSDIGLIEYKRTNHQGIENQVWKDSIEGYVHANGKLLNYDYPVAPIEVQAYAYDALVHYEILFPGSFDKTIAINLRKNTVRRFWIKEQGYFASAIDRTKSGRPRQVKTPSSNGALILDSRILSDMDNGHEMIEQTAHKIMGPDFLTSAGIRCRSIKYKDLIDFPDYHGSYAVWFKETNDIRRGLKRHGFSEYSLKLAGAITSTIRQLGEYYEFVFVDENGSIVPPNKHAGKFTDKRCNIPEPGQSWTISAFLSSLRDLAE